MLLPVTTVAGRRQGASSAARSAATASLPLPPAATRRRPRSHPAGAPKWPRISQKSGLKAQHLLPDDCMVQVGCLACSCLLARASPSLHHRPSLHIAPTRDKVVFCPRRSPAA